jgi:hypothetical protein
MWDIKPHQVRRNGWRRKAFVKNDTGTGFQLGKACVRGSHHDTDSRKARKDSPSHRAALFTVRYLIASGFTGEPTAPVIGIAGATNRNS